MGGYGWGWGFGTGLVSAWSRARPGERLCLSAPIFAPYSPLAYAYPAYVFPFSYGFTYPLYSYAYPPLAYAYPAYAYPLYGYTYPVYSYAYPPLAYAYPDDAYPSYGVPLW